TRRCDGCGARGCVAPAWHHLGGARVAGTAACGERTDRRHAARAVRLTRFDRPAHHALVRSACWRIQACMAMPAATEALMLRVDPNCAIDTTTPAPPRP